MYLQRETGDTNQDFEIRNLPLHSIAANKSCVELTVRQPTLPDSERPDDVPSFKPKVEEVGSSEKVIIQSPNSSFQNSSFVRQLANDERDVICSLKEYLLILDISMQIHLVYLGIVKDLSVLLIALMVANYVFSLPIVIFSKLFAIFLGFKGLEFLGWNITRLALSPRFGLPPCSRLEGSSSLCLIAFVGLHCFCVFCEPENSSWRVLSLGTGGLALLLLLMSHVKVRKSPYIFILVLLQVLVVGSVGFFEFVFSEKEGSKACEILLNVLLIMAAMVCFFSFWYFMLQAREYLFNNQPIGMSLFTFLWFTASLIFLLFTVLTRILSVSVKTDQNMQPVRVLGNITLGFSMFWLMIQLPFFKIVKAQRTTDHFKNSAENRKIKRTIPFFMSKEHSRSYFKRVSAEKLLTMNTEKESAKNTMRTMKVSDVIRVEANGLSAKVHTYSRPNGGGGPSTSRPNSDLIAANICQTQRMLNGELTSRSTSFADTSPICLVCFSHKSEIVVMECGHSDLCKSCGLEIWKSTSKCFICQEAISCYLVIEAVNDELVQVVQTVYLKGEAAQL